MKRILRLLDAISVLIGKAAAWLIMPVVAVVSYEIVARYVFKAPTVWAMETMIYGCALIYVLCSAWVIKEGRHVRIDMVYEHFSPRGKAVMDSITFLAFLIYITFLLWATYKYAYNSVIIFEESDSPWRPPLWPMKVSLALGVALVLMQGLANWIRDLGFAITGKQLWK